MKCLVVATLVMSIISAVSAGGLIIMSGVLLEITSQCGSYHINDEGCGAYVPLSVLIVVGMIMLVVAIVSSVLTCKATCCDATTSQGRLHYTANQTHIQMPSLPTGLEEPPVYQSV